MKKILLLLTKFLRSAIFTYVGLKYLTHGIQFASLMLLARYASIPGFALYASIKLLLQYLSYTNLGVNYSFNNLTSSQKDVSKQRVFSNLRGSLLINLALVLLATSVLLIGPLPQFVEKNDIQVSVFLVYAVVIGIFSLKQLNLLFLGLYRLLNRYGLINLYGISVVAIELLIILLFSESEALIINIFIGQLAVNAVFLVFFASLNARSLFKKIEGSSIRPLFINGISLLAYNFSFYFLMLMVRSFIENKLDQAQFAIFNFAFFVNEGIFLALNAVFFVLLPKVLNMSNQTDTVVLFNKAISRGKLLSFFTIVLVPVTAILLKVLIGFIPEYEDAVAVILLLLLAQAFISNNFLLSSYLLAKRKETPLSVLGFSLVLLWFLLLSYLLRTELITLEIVGLSNILIYFLYNLGTVFILKKKYKINIQIASFFDLRIISMALLYIALVYFGYYPSILLNIAFLALATLFFRKELTQNLAPLLQSISDKKNLDIIK